MTKLPAPPLADELRRRAPIDGHLHTIDSDTLLWRIHRTAGEHVLGWNRLRYFGPAAGRFDPQHPPAGPSSARGVLYLAADSVAVAVAEVFQRTRRVDVAADAPYLTALRLARPVRLLDFTGSWPTQAGASQAISSGPRPRARHWARTIADAWPDLDGLYYPSSMLGGGRCLALYAPAADALPPAPTTSLPLGHPDLWGPLAEACEAIGYQLG